MDDFSFLYTLFSCIFVSINSCSYFPISYEILKKSGTVKSFATYCINSNIYIEKFLKWLNNKMDQSILLIILITALVVIWEIVP